MLLPQMGARATRSAATKGIPKARTPTPAGPRHGLMMKGIPDRNFSKGFRLGENASPARACALPP